MKKILFSIVALFALLTSVVFALTNNYVNMQEDLQNYYNEMFKTPEQEANEAEYALRHTNDPQEIRAQLEKLRYTLYQINKQGIPETQKAAQKRSIEREIEYYEYRLRQLENK